MWTQWLYHEPHHVVLIVLAACLSTSTPHQKQYLSQRVCMKDTKVWEAVMILINALLHKDCIYPICSQKRCGHCGRPTGTWPQVSKPQRFYSTRCIHVFLILRMYTSHASAYEIKKRDKSWWKSAHAQLAINVWNLKYSYMRKILMVNLSLTNAGIPHWVPAKTLCNEKNEKTNFCHQPS